MKVITLARKPCKGTVAITSVEFGTSGLNIDSSRIEVTGKAAGITALGRWPANVILQHHSKCSVECHPECACASLDEQSGIYTSGLVKPRYMKNSSRQASGGGFQDIPLTEYGDSGGASRFFKQVKL